jgi:hypothetical protein
MSDLVVAVAGDSVMWGQGLSDADKFVTISARAIGDLLGKTPNIHWLSTHSGATIVSGPAEDFENTFITTESERDAFLKGNEAAVALHGEIPRTFPTITYQIENMDPEFGKEVDILFLDGGANDIDFSKVLEPNGKKYYWRLLDDQFEQFFYRRMSDLLRAARSRCPER